MYNRSKCGDFKQWDHREQTEANSNVWFKKKDRGTGEMAELERYLPCQIFSTSAKSLARWVVGVPGTAGDGSLQSPCWARGDRRCLECAGQAAKLNS